MPLNFSGLAILCVGNWKFYEKLAPVVSASGELEVQIAKSSLGFTLELTKSVVSGLSVYGNATKILANIEIAKIQFSGCKPILCTILDVVIDVLKKKITDLIDTKLQTVLKHAIDTKLTEALEKIDAKIIPFLGPTVPDVPPPVPYGTMDLHDNALIKFIDGAADRLIGPHGINRLMNSLTNNSGVLAFHNITKASKSINMSLGFLEFGIKEFALVGLNTWELFDIFDPINNTVLSSKTAMDIIGVNLTFFVNVTLFDGVISGLHLYEEAHFSISLLNNHLESVTQMCLNAKAMLSLTGTQFTDGSCIRDSIENINMTEFFLNTTIGYIELKAETGDLEDDLDDALDNLLALFTTSFKAQIPAFINGIIAGPLRIGINNAWAELGKKNETHVCGSAKGADAFDSMTIVIPLSGGLVCVLIVMMLSRHYNVQAERTSGRKWKSLNNVNDDSEQPLLSESVFNSAGNYLPPLMHHQKLSLSFRYSILAAIVFNVCIFIFSNINVGASVYIVITMSGHEQILPPVFQFSLANSVHDMWQAGVYPLAILIALFSGAWPYGKLLIMACCWLLPGHVLSPLKREKALRFIDAYGKYSLTDSFIMIIMLVAFRFHIAAPDGQTMMDVYVGADIGILSFVVGTMMSLILGHVTLAADRKVKSNSDVVALDLPEKYALRNYTFHVNKTVAVRCSKFGQSLLPIALIVSFILLVAGMIIDSFNFKFEGAAALVLTSLNATTNQGYSLISLGLDLPSVAQDPNSFTIRFLQITYLVYAVAVPLCHPILMLILWMVPMTIKCQQHLFVVVEIFHAWSAVDVFVLTVIASLLELEQFALFIVGDRCDGINAIMTSLNWNTFDGVDKCFDVVSTLSEGCFILFFSAAISFGCAYSVMNVCHDALNERIRSISKLHEVDYGLVVVKSSKEKKDCSEKCCSQLSLMCLTLGVIERDE